MVAYAPEGGAKDEGEEGGEGKLVCVVEGEIAVSWGSFEETGEGDC